jgi:hypothetical protein
MKYFVFYWQTNMYNDSITPLNKIIDIHPIQWIELQPNKEMLRIAWWQNITKDLLLL